MGAIVFIIVQIAFATRRICRSVVCQSRERLSIGFQNPHVFQFISRLVTLTETLIILDITKTESNNCFYYTLKEKKNGSHVFASSLTASNTKRANLT